MLRIVLGLVLSALLATTAFAAKTSSKEGMKLLAGAQLAYEAKEWDKVIGLTTKALEEKLTDEHKQVAHQLRAISFMSKTPKDCKSALPDIDEVVKATPENHQFLATQAICQNELKVGDRGLAAYTAAIALDSANAAYYQGRCFIYYQAEKNAEAIEDCKKATMLNQTDVQSLKVIASAEHKMGRKKEALEAWEAVLAAAPNDEMAKKNVEGLKKEVAKGQ
jgi:tetratricopeptide (TPR) repeat protein